MKDIIFSVGVVSYGIASVCLILSVAFEWGNLPHGEPYPLRSPKAVFAGLFYLGPLALGAAMMVSLPLKIILYILRSGE